MGKNKTYETLDLVCQEKQHFILISQCFYDAAYIIYVVEKSSKFVLFNFKHNIAIDILVPHCGF